MSAKKRILALLLAVVMTVLAFAGCKSNTDSTDNPSDNGGNSGTTTKAITVDLTQEPPQLNSMLTTSTGSMNVLRHIVEGLMILDENDNPVPGMAESYEISDDQLTYTFHLRKDGKWSNGEPVTANDFIFAWNTFFTPATAAPYASTWMKLIEGATEAMATKDDAALADALKNIGYKALDEYTIEVKLANPAPFFLSVLAFPNFFPVNEKAYNEIGADAYATEADKIVTNGAFKMTKWEHESEIVLTKSEDYYGKDNIKLDQITMKMIKDSNARENSFNVGDLDMINLTGDQATRMKDAGQDVITFDDGGSWYFEFNTTQKGLNNKKVRQALTLGVDMDTFIKSVVKNNSTVAYSFTPPAISHGEFTEATGKLLNRVEDGDYSKVKALLEEGLKEEGMTVADLKVSIVADDTDNAGKFAAYFQNQWKTNLGVEAQIEQMPYKSRLQRMESKDFSIVFAGWGPDYNDPMTFLDIFTTGNGNNHTSFSSAKYDELIAKATAEADTAKRQEYMIECEKILADELPIGISYNRKTDYVLSKRLTGVVRTAFQDINLLYADVVEVAE